MKNHSIEFLCSGCALRLRAKQSALGKHLKCPKCSAVVLVKKEMQNDPEVLENFNFGHNQIQNENQVIEHNDLLKSHLILNKKNKTEIISENIQSASSTEINIQKIKTHAMSNNTGTEKPHETLVGCLGLIFLAGSLIFGFFMYDHYQTTLKETKDKNNILVKNEERNNIKLAEIDKKLVQIREDNEIKHAQRVAEKAAEKAAEKEMELEAIRKKAAEKAAEKEMELEAIRKKAAEKYEDAKMVAARKSKVSNDLYTKQIQKDVRESYNKKRGVVTLTSLADVRAICETPSQYIGLTAYLPACYVKAENISRNSAVNGHLFSFSTGDNLSNLETFGNSIFIQKYNLNFGMGSKIADDFKALNYLRRTRIEIALSGIQDRLSVPIRDTFKWKYATMNMKFYVKELSSDTYIAELLTLFVSE